MNKWSHFNKSHSSYNNTAIYMILVALTILLTLVISNFETFNTIKWYFDNRVYDKSTEDYKEKYLELSERFESLEAILLHQESHRSQKMRITGYKPSGNKTAIGKRPVVGRTAAVSRKCLSLLGYRVYVEGIGLFNVEDITAKWVDEDKNMCTLDISVSSDREAAKLTRNDGVTVVKIEEIK